MPREDTDVTAPHSEAQGVGFGAQTPDNWTTPPKNVAAGLDAAAAGGIGVYLQNVVEDTSPTLGGNLAGGGKQISNVLTLQVTVVASVATLQLTGDKITDSNGDECLLFTAAGGTVVNELTIGNAETGDGPSLTATGTDANINLVFDTKGTGASKFRRSLDVEFEGTSRFSCKTCHVSDYAKWRMTRARGTIASPANVVTGDIIGKFEGVTYYGGSWRYQVAIRFLLDGAPSGSAAPAKIEFQTSPTGIAVTRFTIFSGGDIRVASTNKLEFTSALVYIQATSAGNLKVYASTSTDMQIGGTSRIELNTTGIGFFNVVPVARQDITGARDVPEEALADLLTKLALLGLVTDSTTAS